MQQTKVIKLKDQLRGNTSAPREADAGGAAAKSAKSQHATLTLLGKGPRFIPKSRALSTTEVLGACARLNYRLVRALQRFVNRKECKRREAIRREMGIQQRSLSTEYCRAYVSRFFKCADVNGTWKGIFKETSSYLSYSNGTCSQWSKISFDNAIQSSILMLSYIVLHCTQCTAQLNIWQ